MTEQLSRQEIISDIKAGTFFAINGLAMAAAGVYADYKILKNEPSDVEAFGFGSGVLAAGLAFAGHGIRRVFLSARELHAHNSAEATQE